MRNTVAIVRKELSIYFTTVIAYAGFGAFAFLMGLLFITSVNRFQQLSTMYAGRQQMELIDRLNFNDLIISPMFSTGVWMFLFFVPFLTMRLLAEEKSGRTFELLMSAPIRSADIVLGKFIAVGALIAVMTAIPLMFPVILDFYGTTGADGGPVDWAPVWCASAMFWLLGMSFCSVGLFVSSLTESQIVAAIITFALLLAAFVLPMMAARLSGDWRVIVEYISPISHVGRALEGRLLLRDLVYFASSISLFLFLTHRVVESHRWR